MTLRTKGLLVLAVQLLLVLSIAAKFQWERHTRPRVWTRTTQFDPDLALRGRYLALSLTASACALPMDDPAVRTELDPGKRTIFHRWWEWKVRILARDGRLSAVLAGDDHPEEAFNLTLNDGVPCDRATLGAPVDFFIPEHAQSPFPLARGAELWVEVTVPTTGPPRPIQLAVASGPGFHILTLR